MSTTACERCEYDGKRIKRYAKESQNDQRKVFVG